MTERNCNSVMVMAGGTGGHVFPALAVALVLRDRDIKVTWLGTRKGIESDVVPDNKFPIDYIDVEGVRGRGLVKLLKAPFLLMLALFQALRVMRKEKPSVVLGLGGFASGPGGVAARILGLPLVIHEQNAIAGTTNKWLANIASRVLQAFPKVLPRGEWVGNPVRKEIEALPMPSQRQDEASRPLRLLVLGGSLGAQAINQRVPEALAMLNKAAHPEVRHQCGRQNLTMTEQAYQRAAVTAEIETFIDDMAGAYEWADAVICRAGALTVSELTAAGLGALLIPYPHAIDDHQTKNAEWLVAQQAALLISEHELTKEWLANLLNDWTADRSELQTMGLNARKLAKKGVAELIADVCQEVCVEQ